MNSKAGKLLVVESDDALREQIVAALSGAGYEVSTDYREGMKAVLGFNPDAVVLGADPPQLDHIVTAVNHGEGGRQGGFPVLEPLECVNRAVLVEHIPAHKRAPVARRFRPVLYRTKPAPCLDYGEGGREGGVSCFTLYRRNITITVTAM